MEPSMEITTLIFIDILPKLPMKSLVRFKTVSKQWQDFITNSVYLKKALSRREIQTDTKISQPLQVKNLEFRSQKKNGGEDITSSNGLVLPIPDQDISKITEVLSNMYLLGSDNESNDHNDVLRVAESSYKKRNRSDYESLDLQEFSRKFARLDVCC